MKEKLHRMFLKNYLFLIILQNQGNFSQFVDKQKLNRFSLFSNMLKIDYSFFLITNLDRLKEKVKIFFSKEKIVKKVWEKKVKKKKGICRVEKSTDSDKNAFCFVFERTKEKKKMRMRL